MKQQDFLSAANFYDAAIFCDPTNDRNERAWFFMGFAFEFAGFYPNALEAYLKAESLGKHFTTKERIEIVEKKMNEIRSQGGKFKEAKKLKNFDPNTMFTNLTSGRDYFYIDPDDKMFNK